MILCVYSLICRSNPIIISQSVISKYYHKYTENAKLNPKIVSSTCSSLGDISLVCPYSSLLASVFTSFFFVKSINAFLTMCFLSQPDITSLQIVSSTH